MVNNDDGEETTSQGNEQNVYKAAESEEGEEAMPRGNEWEVVSLTASAYAAAPGPRGDESIHEEKDPTLGEDYEAETSRALFMSGHFVFPPSQHENLPIESESLKNSKGEDDVGDLNVAKESKAEQKEEENWSIEGLNVPEEFLGIPFLEEKSSRLLSVHGSGFDDSTTLHRLAVDDKEQNVYEAATFSSFNSGTEIGGSAAYGESLVENFDEPSDHGLDPSSFISRPPKSGEEEFGEIDDSGLPCGAWWKRSVASLCAQVKDTNAFWSVFVAAAVMGLVILGQRWQQERWEVLQQRWQLSVGNEKSGRILSRLKDVIVGGSRRSTYITAAPADH
ncbi:ATG8-interacting protein 2-like [Chenopodium quinoa]|uniref:ATG8-interacting protein 2-like n=1 Tax=Chenopodium quinoa TaxID=63459 RepID=UPI000B796753|nr:ATG8-interacting protein 2-like [Chenopodium quinoa]